MAWVHTTIIRPSNYLHSDCFYEVVEGLHHALAALGQQVSFAENHVETNATTNVVFGAHLLSESTALTLPQTCVIYNLEQLGFSRTPSWYMSFAARTRIWDYSHSNLAVWRSVPHRHEPLLLPVGYMPQLSRLARVAQQDIDVLFYGSLTNRRQRIICELENAGVSVHVAFGVYGKLRDDLIARAKIVLNVHATAGGLFEVVRVSWLLANRKAVVSEQSDDMDEFRDAVASCEYEKISAMCLYLLGNEHERRQLEERGFLLFSRRDQVKMLREVLTRTTSLPDAVS